MEILSGHSHEPRTEGEVFLTTALSFGTHEPMLCMDPLSERR